MYDVISSSETGVTLSFSQDFSSLFPSVICLCYRQYLFKGKAEEMARQTSDCCLWWLLLFLRNDSVLWLPGVLWTLALCLRESDEKCSGLVGQSACVVNRLSWVQIPAAPSFLKLIHKILIGHSGGNSTVQTKQMSQTFCDLTCTYSLKLASFSLTVKMNENVTMSIYRGTFNTSCWTGPLFVPNSVHLY